MEKLRICEIGTTVQHPVADADYNPTTPSRPLIQRPAWLPQRPATGHRTTNYGPEGLRCGRRGSSRRAVTARTRVGRRAAPPNRRTYNSRPVGGRAAPCSFANIERHRRGIAGILQCVNVEEIGNHVCKCLTRSRHPNKDGQCTLVRCLILA